MSKISKSSKVQTEKQVVTSCHAWFKRGGWIPKTLYTGGIPTRTGIVIPNPAKGIPDSVNFNPELKLLVWVEYKKTGGGKLSLEQVAWHNLLRRCGAHILVVDSLASLKSQISAIVFNSTYYKMREAV